MSPELFSSQLIPAFLRFSQLFSKVSAFRSSSYVFSSLLSSSHIFSAFLASPQLISALVSSSHLISALLSAVSNHVSSSLTQNLLQKRISAPEQATPTFSQRKTEKHLHAASFYTERLVLTGKLFLTKSFYTQQAFTQKP